MVRNKLGLIWLNVFVLLLAGRATRATVHPLAPASDGAAGAIGPHRAPAWAGVAVRLVRIMGVGPLRQQCRWLAELPVRPWLSGLGSADFRYRPRSIEAGRVAMETALLQLQAEFARL